VALCKLIYCPGSARGGVMLCSHDQPNTTHFFSGTPCFYLFTVIICGWLQYK